MCINLVFNIKFCCMLFKNEKENNCSTYSYTSYLICKVLNKIYKLYSVLYNFINAGDNHISNCVNNAPISSYIKESD